MNVKSKCTIPANHFEYFIMGAKYHYSPPVQSTPSPTVAAHRPSRKPRANSSVTVRYGRARMESASDRDRDRGMRTDRQIERNGNNGMEKERWTGAERERGRESWHLLRARKEDGGEGGRESFP